MAEREESARPALIDTDAPTAAQTTQASRWYTARIEFAEQRKLLRAERIAQNTYRRLTAFDFDNDYYEALRVNRAA